MELANGNAITFKKFGDGIEITMFSHLDIVVEHVTNSEALELAAELVKLAMPDAKPDTAPVSIM